MPEPEKPTLDLSSDPSPEPSQGPDPKTSTPHPDPDAQAEGAEGAERSGGDSAGPTADSQSAALGQSSERTDSGPAAAATARDSTFSTAPFQPGPALWGIAVLAALFLISAGVFVGTLLDGPRSEKQDPPTSAPAEVDVGFLRDMQTHHAQAVQMAVLIRDRTDGEEIRKVALDIELTQQQQIGQMYALLASWGEPQSNPNPMAWMTSDTGAGDTDDPHAGMAEMPGADGSAMPGMASAADLERLASLRGTAAERLFLELMIAHHQGGIPMATAAAKDADESWVRTLAQSIVDAQSAEITALQAMLDDRGGPLG